MTPWVAVWRGLRRYAGFSGRSGRPEFWWWALAVGIVHMAVFGFFCLGSALSGPGASGEPALDWFFLVLYFVVSGLLVGLPAFLPTTAVAVRRLHDVGRTGWWVLCWYMAPLVAGAFFLLMFMATLGQSLAGRGPSAAPSYIAGSIFLLAIAGVVIWAVLWLSTPGDAEPNRFGDPPLG